MDMMRAAVLTHPGRFEVREVPIPPIGPDDALIRVDRCGICGTDIHIFRGHYAADTLPFIPGHEFTGTVSRVGDRVQGLQVGFSVLSVVASWAVVHTVYMLRYARVYYTGPDGGANFHQDESPRYTDFAYLAFTVGMTFQVSDTELNAVAFRRNVLRHALLSYLFGTVIVALAINLVAGLSR